MTYLEIDDRLRALPVYIWWLCTTKYQNTLITHNAVSKHYIYTFEEFYNSSINAEAGLEPLVSYYKKRM